MAKYSSLYEAVITIISEVIGVSIYQINNASHLYDNLNIDSFAATEILNRFEQEFNIQIDSTNFQDAIYVADIISILEEIGVSIDDNDEDEISTIDDDGISSQADLTDSNYLATEFDIFTKNSKKILTYKTFLDNIYSKNKRLNATTSINSIAPYFDEKFVLSGSTNSPVTGSDQLGQAYIDISTSIATSAYKTFTKGLTQYAGSAALAVSFSIGVQFAHSTSVTNTEDDNENYDISTASLDFDNEGSQTSNVEDTGIGYNISNTMSGNSRANDGTTCFATDLLSSCSTDSTSCAFDGTSCTVTSADKTGVCITIRDTAELPCGGSFTSGCSISDLSGCVATTTTPPPEDTTYTISYTATAYIKGTDIAVASKSSSMSITDPFTMNRFATNSISIPVFKWFNLDNTDEGFGFNIKITATIYDTTLNQYQRFINIYTATYTTRTFYVFNPNDKAVKYQIAHSIYNSHTLNAII